MSDDLSMNALGGTIIKRAEAAIDAGCDIILCTLTMHHFTDQQICTFIKTFVQLASTGVIINDLQRSKIAYRLFQLFSGIFMKSKL